MFLPNSGHFNPSPTLSLPIQTQALNLVITQVGNFGGDARAKLFSAIHFSPPTLPAFFRAYTNCLNTKPLSRQDFPRHNFLQHNALDAFSQRNSPKMSERKVLQKYYPPDFDPAALGRRKSGNKDAGPRTQKVRIMAPWSMRCDRCGTFIVSYITEYRERGRLRHTMYGIMGLGFPPPLRTTHTPIQAHSNKNTVQGS